MHCIRSVLAGMLFSTVVSAQAGIPTTARAEHDKLAAEWTAVGKAYSEAIRAVMATEDYQTAQTAKDTQKLTELRQAVTKPDGAAFGTRALAMAQAFKGDDCLLLLSWAATNLGDAATVKEVAAQVKKDHLKSAALAGLLENAMSLSRALGADETNALLDAVVAQSPHALPKAWAKYWQAVTIQRDKNATDESKTKADVLLVDAEALAAGTDLAVRIAAPRFEKDRLQIGQAAPDIVGEDIDAVPFKLSDYQGKVVVLDFWGFW